MLFLQNKKVQILILKFLKDAEFEWNFKNRNFTINGQFHLNLSEVRNLSLHFGETLKSVSELSFLTRKTSVKKSFFQNFKGLLFFTG